MPELEAPRKRVHSWCPLWVIRVFVIILCPFPAVVIFILATTMQMKGWEYYSHSYNKYQESPEQIHVANLNFEMFGNTSLPVYCTG